MIWVELDGTHMHSFFFYFTHNFITCKQTCLGPRPDPGPGPDVFCTLDRSQLFGSNWRDICDETFC